MSNSVQHGSTDQRFRVRLVTTAGIPATGVAWNAATLAIWFQQKGAAKTAITLALGTGLDATHSDGKWNEIGDGYYQVDTPDAAYAASAVSVQFGGSYTGHVVFGEACPLVAYNPQAVAVGAMASYTQPSGFLAATFPTTIASSTNISDTQTAIINAINNLNQGTARFISIECVEAIELPDSGTVVTPIIIRTYDADGEPTAANGTPTITASSGTLSLVSGNVLITGEYNCTLTHTAGTHGVGPVLLRVDATIGIIDRETLKYVWLTDAVAVDFTAADRTKLNTIHTNVDVATSSRNAIAPDNAGVAAIKAKTDQMVFTVPNQVDANALTGGGGGDAEQATSEQILAAIANQNLGLQIDNTDLQLLADRSYATNFKVGATPLLVITVIDRINRSVVDISTATEMKIRVDGFDDDFIAGFLTDGTDGSISYQIAEDDFVVGSYKLEAHITMPTEIIITATTTMRVGARLANA